MGSVSADSDLEVTDNRNITRVAMEPSGAGTIRIWDTPSILTWTNFFAANPTATLRVQFSSIGPAYELTRGRQGGNFSNWSTSNTDARTAIHNARASGQKFILALASPGLDLDTNLAERINIQEILTVRSPRLKLDEQINIIDSIHTQLARVISRTIQEQINIQEIIDTQLIQFLNETAQEQINIQDIVDTQSIKYLVENIPEQITIQDVISILVTNNIDKDIAEHISITDLIGPTPKTSVITKITSSISWPSTLPNELSRQRYSEYPMNNIIRSKTTYGTGSRRPRYTSTPILYSGTILLSDTEYVIFRNFYFNVLKAGFENFVFPNLLLSQNKYVRFVSKPSRRRENKKWRISISLRSV